MSRSFSFPLADYLARIGLTELPPPDPAGLDTLVRAQLAGIAFEIGFLIYIPFLILDMVVASVLLSMGIRITSYNVCYTKLLRARIAMDFATLLGILSAFGLVAVAMVQGGNGPQLPPLVRSLPLCAVRRHGHSYNFV